MTVHGHAGGYRLQTSAMDSEAQTLDTAGDDVGVIARAVKDTACYTSDALGGSDAGPAYNNFAGDWQAEAKVLESALHELADKVRVSKANYQGAEHATIRGMSAAGGDGVTTMPAPAEAGPTPGHRTMPAPGTPPRGLSDFD
ncbi:WXG100 family type VII secretion target [Streptomyces sp. NPDC057740]|uniref:WXG100 family type VII secretion target n=1 Tax=Streptomyces sp. NPDC057740 TaxID=3346234 RepID=UPI00369A207F